MMRGSTVSDEAVEKARSSSSPISLISFTKGILAKKAMPPRTTTTKSAMVT
ncbi:hypothetical protein D3C78_1895690 [compost metagenome]